MDAPAIVAIIGGIALLAGIFGGIRAKDITVSALPRSIRIISSLLGVMLIGVSVFLSLPKSMQSMASTQTPSPLPTSTPDPCFSARIQSPQGAHDKKDAAAYPVSNNIKITWEPTNCVMIVQYYQKQELRHTYENVVSGSEINIGEAGSGETEIKIWREGYEDPTESIWVWVK